MKHLYKAILIATAALLPFLSNGQDINWSFDTDGNGSNAQATSSNSAGVVATYTASGQVLVSGVFGTGADPHVFAQSPSTSSVTISFSQAVDLTSIQAGEFSSTKTWTATPTGGSNSAVSFSVGTSPSTKTLNWTGITSFTLSTSGGSNFAIDDFVIPISCNDPDVPVITATPSTVCPGSSSTLSWTGSLNSALNWVVYSGSCGGTQVGSTTNNSLQVTPSSTTTYYIRGEGDCVTPGSCGQATVTVTTTSSPSFTALADLCVDAGVQTGQGGGTPTGGVYSGTGVTDDGNGTTYSFDPATAGVGTHQITYTITSSGCPVSASDDVVVGCGPIATPSNLMFVANDGTNTNLYGYNATTGRVVPVAIPNPGSTGIARRFDIFEYNNKVYCAYFDEDFVTQIGAYDGRDVDFFGSISTNFDPETREFVVYNGDVYFTYEPSGDPRHVYKLDLTTETITDLTSATLNRAGMDGLVVYNDGTGDKLYFAGRAGSSGATDLYMWDGTTLSAAPNFSLYEPGRMAVYNGYIYMSASTSSTLYYNDTELYRYNGSGTSLVHAFADLSGTAATDPDPRDFITFDSKLFFVGGAGFNPGQYRLYSVNSSNTVTQEYSPTSGYAPQDLMVVGSNLYFGLNTASYPSQTYHFFRYNSAGNATNVTTGATNWNTSRFRNANAFGDGIAYQQDRGNGDEPQFLNLTTSTAAELADINSGTGDALQNNTINVFYVTLNQNTAPVVDVGNDLSILASTASATVVNSSLNVYELDDSQIDSAEVSFSSGFQAGDVLSATASGGISVSYNSTTGVLSLSGSASPSAYQTVLRTVAFDPTTTAGTRELLFTATDGSGNTSTVVHPTGKARYKVISGTVTTLDFASQPTGVPTSGTYVGSFSLSNANLGTVDFKTTDNGLSTAFASLALSFETDSFGFQYDNTGGRIEVHQVEEDPYEHPEYMALKFANDAEFVAFDAADDAFSFYDRYTITGFNDGVQVAQETIIGASSATTYIVSASGFASVDEIRIKGSDSFGGLYAGWGSFLDNFIFVQAACSDPDVPTVTFSPSTVCVGATATLNISGSLNDATAWHVYTGSCGGTSVGSTTGSTITVSPGTPSTTYYVRGEGGCVTAGSCGSVTITPTAVDDASFSYSASNYCVDASDPTPTITGTTGGTFSSTSGLSLNTSSGAIDVSASTAGTYSVTYTTAGSCPANSTVSVTITALDNAAFSYGSSSYCKDASDPSPTITGVTGGTFSSTVGLSIASNGTIDVSASTAGTYTVTYTTAGTCPNSSTASVTINNLDDASFSYGSTSYCVDASDPTPTISGLTGGSFSSTVGLSLSSSTGAIDVSASTPGTYTVTYTTAGTCPNSSNTSVTINALDDASFSYGQSEYCSTGSDPTPTITGLTGGTFSSGVGLSIASGSGAIDLSASTPGTYTVTYTTSGTCPNSSSTTVTVADDVTAVCQAVTLQLNASGSATLTTGAVDNGSSATCGIASYTLSQTAFSCSDLGGNEVTLTVTSNSGRTASCSTTITVVDNISPTAICRNVTVQLDANGNGSITTADVNNGSTDNCTIASYALSETSFTCSDLGSNTVTLSVTDNSGNVGTCMTTVTVVDNISPTALCQNVTVQLDADGNGSITTADVNNGSTDNCTITGYALSETSFTCSDLGSNTVTLTVTDQSGNYSTCMTTVTVVDDISPTAICQAVTVWLDASGNGSISVTDVNDGSTDNCSITGYSLSQTSFTCSNLGSNTVTLTVTDQSGNYSTCMTTVTVVDNISPTAICQNVTVQLDANGNGSITTADVNNGSTDNCTIASYALSETSFTCSDLGSNTVTLSVTDNSGNVGTCMTTVTVVDNISPTALCQNVTVQLDANGNGSITTADVNNGSTDNCTIAGYALSETSFTCSDLGSNTVTLSVTDNSGNVGTCMTTITVVDNISPTAICQNITVQLDATGNVSITGGQIDDGSSDNCTISSLTASPNSFTCSDIGANTVTLTVTDQSGNSSTCTATVTVEDNIAPNAQCQDFTDLLPFGGTYILSPASIDNGSSDACGIASYTISQTTFNATHLGANTVYLTVTDNNGNSSVCSSTFTLTSSPPDIICQDITVQLDATGAASITPNMVDNGSSSPYGVPLLMTVAPYNFSCQNIGANTVTLTATDSYGQSATCTATVTVVDQVAPQVTCQDVSIVLDASGSASISTSDVVQSSTDACGAVTLSLDKSTFDCTNVGSNVVTVTATDVNGNTSTCSATITVSDQTAPTALCKNVTIQLDATGAASLSTSDVDNGSSDVCTAVTLSLDKTSFDCSDIGVQTVVMTVVDAYGNTSTCSAQVSVVDHIAPQAQCQNVTLQLNGSGQANLTPSMVNAGSTDNCSIASYTLSKTSFDCGDLGTNMVTMTVTDASGNSSTCTATITVEDQVAPVLNCQSVTYSLINGQVTIDVNDFIVNASDNCSSVSLSANLSTFDCTQLGTFTIDITGVDAQGNSTTCSPSVTIVDNALPTAVCQNATLILDNSGQATLSAMDIDGGSSASCGGTLTYALSQTSFDCSHLGVNSVSLTVTDGNGNSATCTAQVTVVDNTPPVAMCQDINVVLDASGQATILPSSVDNGSSDVCGGVTLSLDQTQFTCVHLGTNSVILTVTDGSGNSSTCGATVTVLDQTPPAITCLNPTVTLNASGIVTILPNQMASATDLCGAVTLTASIASFNCSHAGSTVPVTLTATDASGNVSTCTSNVTVVDNNVPSVTCKNVTVSLDANGNASISTSDVVASSLAPCGVAGVTVSQSQFDCSDLGANSVVITVTGNNGQTATCSATVTVVDNMAPNVTCQNANIYLDANGQPVLTVTDLGLIFSDNCGVTGANYDISQFDCDNTGVQSLAIVVSDASGNTTTCTSQVTVLDTVSPTISCQNVSVQLDASGQATLASSDALVSGTDNCPGTTYALSKSTFDCSDLGTQLVTLTATDASGNQSTCDFVVTVSDQTPPSLVCSPTTFSIGTAGIVNLSSTSVVQSSTDNCSGTTITLSQTAFTCSDVGSNTITVTATDASGNSVSCTTTVTITDMTGPTITCPSNIIANNDPNTCGAAVTFAAPVAVDGCGTVTVTQTDNTGLSSGSTFPVGTTTLSFSAQDPSGNTSTCSFDITVVDTEAPQVSCPATVNANAQFGQSSTVVNYTTPTAVDNCGNVTVNQTAGIPSGGVFPVGITVNTFEFTDQAGNMASCSVDVIVSDGWAPQVQCPNDITANVDAGQCAATVTFNDPVVLTPGTTTTTRIDNNTNLVSGSQFPLGTTLIQWQIARPNGSSSFCSMSITVADNENPIISCPQNISVSNDAGQCGAIVNYAVPTATDNCTNVSLTRISGPASGSVFPIGTTAISYQATDDAGNTSQCTFTVTVSDQEAPVLSCPSNITVSSTGSSCNAIVSYPFPTATDNCPGQVTIAQSGNSSSGIYPVGTTSITFTATDASGNTSTCSFSITVTPSITVSLGPAVTECSVATLVPQAPSGGTYQWSTGSNASLLTVTQSGTYSVTVTYPGGCSASDAVSVTITGNPNVSISGMPPNNFYCLDLPALTLTGSPAGGTFSGPGMTGNSFDPAASGSGTFTIFYNYTDANGCSGQASEQITVLPCDVSLEEEHSFQVQMFPNPTSTEVKLEWTSSRPGEVDILVVNTLGQLMYEQAQPSGSSSVTIPVHQWANGQYTVLIQHEYGVERKRLVVQH
ncbi:HYR domain-containing protein [Cryomorphaceae bacterium]|nr:HYR domain-containing protein [Cryomorphaceae bacterium]